MFVCVTVCVIAGASPRRAPFSLLPLWPMAYPNRPPTSSATIAATIAGQGLPQRSSGGSGGGARSTSCSSTTRRGPCLARVPARRGAGWAELAVRGVWGLGGAHARLPMTRLASRQTPCGLMGTGWHMLRRMATGCFVSTGRSLSDAIARVKLAESLGYEAVVRDARGRARVADGRDRVRAGDEQHPRRPRRRADLHAHAGDDGADGRDDRRAVRRAAEPRASASRTARSSRAGTGRRSTSRSPRCASTRRSCARSCAARTRRRREVADGLSPAGHRAAPAAADLRRRALPRDAATRRRDRRRRAAVAVQPAATSATWSIPEVDGPDANAPA